MIPSRGLTQDELIRRLKTLVDILSDPDTPILTPALYAESYARLLNLISKHPEKMRSKHVLHNLGAERVRFLSDLTGKIYVRPEYGKKSKTLRTLKGEKDG